MTSAFGSWIYGIHDLVARFQAAEPFPHLVIEEFLADDLAQGLLDEFPSIHTMPHSRDYIFGDKHELSSVKEAGTASATFTAAVTGPDFEGALSAFAGREVFVDPMFHGGGFHQGQNGSYLDMHVDFNVHPLHEDWHRVINCLLYLNRSWEPSHGGELLIKNSPESEPTVIAPLFNRAVIMLTDLHTFHGYRKMSLPDGFTRKSIATYAYEKFEVGSIRPLTTGWAPESPSLVKRIVASRYDTAVKLKNRILGSGTARNR